MTAASIATTSTSAALVATQRALPKGSRGKIRQSVGLAESAEILDSLPGCIQPKHVRLVILGYSYDPKKPELVTFLKECSKKLPKAVLEHIGSSYLSLSEMTAMDGCAKRPLRCALARIKMMQKVKDPTWSLIRSPESERAALRELHYVHDVFSRICDLEGSLLRNSESRALIDQRNLERLVIVLDASIPHAAPLPQPRDVPQMLDWMRNHRQSLTELQEINVSLHQITLLPSAVFRLTQVTDLNASSNKLVSLSPAIGMLSRLRSLDLSRNHLTSLTQALCSLTQLTSLDLSKNLLISLPEAIGEMPLRILIARNNRLTSLPASITKLPLVDLDVSHNEITHLPQGIANWKSLMVLSLHFNRLTYLTREMQSLIQLRSLAIGSNRLSHETIRSLSEELRRLLGNDDYMQNVGPQGIVQDVRGRTPWPDFIKFTALVCVALALYHYFLVDSIRQLIG